VRAFDCSASLATWLRIKYYTVLAARSLSVRTTQPFPSSLPSRLERRMLRDTSARWMAAAAILSIMKYGGVGYPMTIKTEVTKEARH
jgi:hypothetical protein